MSMLVRCILLATAATALVPRTTTVRRTPRRTGRAGVTMRYGIRDRKIRSSINKQVYAAETIEDLAAIMGHPYMDTVGYKMGKHLMVKLRSKAKVLGYDIGYLEPEDEDLFSELSAKNVDLTKPVDLDAFYGDDAESVSLVSAPAIVDEDAPAPLSLIHI